MLDAATVAVVIFVATYVLIATEWIHKTYAALAGALLVVWLGIITQERALARDVDWNTIFLLLGLMLIINVLRPTGVFEYLAQQVVRLAKGQPMRAVLGLCALTALMSPLIDNVTAILLIAPVSIGAARRLKVDPALVVILEVLASNIGGTATLIGDPPNIIIGGAAKLGFMPFLINLGPVVVLILAAYFVTAWLVLKKQLGAAQSEPLEVTTDLESPLRDIRFLRLGLGVLALTVLGFIFHDAIGVQPATVALTGAVIMLVLSEHKPHDMFAEVHWTTLFFFIGLFVLVGGLMRTGVVAALSDRLFSATQGDVQTMSLSILWGSAVASAFVDNIPFVATMSGLVKDIAADLNPGMAQEAAMHAPNVLPLWWSLALGSCLGGNYTIIGASANIVGAGIVEREHGRISFWQFAKYGVLFTTESLLIATAYVWLRYL